MRNPYRGNFKGRHWTMWGYLTGFDDDGPNGRRATYRGSQFRGRFADKYDKVPAGRITRISQLNERPFFLVFIQTLL
ncbi:hypothetical protein TNCV_993191 [Trichonephila clavipes]|nr:hypothetical protein TNCV_993191 [Trichonephila clavipes]